MSFVQSCDWIFVFSCWICACACICAIAWSSLGAQLTHSPRSVFQQIWSQTHWPQLWHCLKYGCISCTAFASALSRVELRCALAYLAAKHVAAEAEQPAAEAGHRMLEGRGITVSAPAAVKLELIP